MTTQKFVSNHGRKVMNKKNYNNSVALKSPAWYSNMVSITMKNILSLQDIATDILNDITTVLKTMYAFHSCTVVVLETATILHQILNAWMYASTAPLHQMNMVLQRELSM